MIFLKNISGVFATKAVFLFCGLISGAITARWLGPDGRGILSVVTSLPSTIWMISCFGINQANVYYIGKKKFPLSTIISNAFVVPLSIGCLICLFLWLSKEDIILKYIPVIDRYYLLLIIFVVLIMTIQNSYLGVLRGVEKFHLINLRQVSRSIIGLLYITVALIILNGGVITVVLGAIVFDLCLMMWLLYEISKISPITISFNLNAAKKIFSFGVKSYVQNMIGYLHNRIDLYMVAYFLAASEIAFYDITVIIAELLLFLPQSVTFVILPKLVRLGNDEKISVVTKIGRVSFAISCFCSIFLICTSKYFIEVVYGKEYLDAFIPLCLLIPGFLFSSIKSVIVPYFTSRHMQKITIVASFISLAANIILNSFLIPSYGIMGAAISTSITYSLYSLTVVFVFVYQNRIPFNELFLIKKSDIIVIKEYIKGFIRR